MELETEKVNVELNAEAAGRLTILAEAGETVKIGAVIGKIDETAEKSAAAPAAATAPQPAPAAEQAAPAAAPLKDAPMNPAVPKIAAERGIDPATLTGSGRDGRVLVDDIPAAAEQKVAPAVAEKPAATPTQAKPEKTAVATEERITRVPMTQIRKKIAAHLMKARHETAMLTTFNEIDMSKAMAMRKTWKEAFQDKHGVGLGFMSFFVKACAEALQQFPEVNGSIDGDDIIYHNYYDIGIAVGSKRGLVVPIIRDCDTLSFADVEKTIRDFAERAGKGKLGLDELDGGTFTITNGGVYGSLLSTPLLNPPQSAILGMHGIQERPVVRDGEIVIRSMMNVALSYDHRIIDGTQSVQFLKQIKNYVENPEALLLQV